MVNCIDLDEVLARKGKAPVLVYLLQDSGAICGSPCLLIQLYVDYCCVLYLIDDDKGCCCSSCRWKNCHSDEMRKETAVLALESPFRFVLENPVVCRDGTYLEDTLEESMVDDAEAEQDLRPAGATSYFASLLSAAPSLLFPSYRDSIIFSE